MPLTVASSLSVTSVDWSGLDTILLDMDGTILDLAFDNHFWGTVIPREWGLKRGLDTNTSQQRLAPVFANEQGKLNWYCLDFWGDTLDLDIPAIKAQYADGIRWRPRQRLFTATAGQSSGRGVDHQRPPPDAEMKAERLPIAQWFDKMISSHDYGAPKETPAFWNALMGERPSTLSERFSWTIRSMFGFGEGIWYRRPHHAATARLDSPAARVTRFPAIHHFDEISEGLPRID